jgi:proliferating cell nuclear antigen PCNA
MKLTFGQEFKHLVIALNEILDGHLILQFKKSGLYCKMTDDATICLIELFLHKNKIIQYDITEGETIGIDMKLLHKIMKNIKYDLIHLSKTSNETLKIITEGNNRKCEFELPLVDTIIDDINIPEINYDCIFTMDKTIFQTVCKELKQFGEDVTLTITNDTEILFCTKDEIECKIMVDVINIENEENIQLNKKYDLKYFLKILKANQISDDVISFYESQNMPLVIEYKMDDMESYIRYYLGNNI